MLCLSFTYTSEAARVQQLSAIDMDTTPRDASARAQASSSASHHATRGIQASNANSEKLAPRMKVDGADTPSGAMGQRDNDVEGH